MGKSLPVRKSLFWFEYQAGDLAGRRLFDKAVSLFERINKILNVFSQVRIARSASIKKPFALCRLNFQRGVKHTLDFLPAFRGHFLFGDLVVQPCFSRIPFAFDSRGRNPQGLGDLIDLHPGKIL